MELELKKNGFLDIVSQAILLIDELDRNKKYFVVVNVYDWNKSEIDNNMQCLKRVKHVLKSSGIDNIFVPSDSDKIKEGDNYGIIKCYL